METISISKEVFGKILADAELLIDDIELALDKTVRKRIEDIKSGKVEAKSEMELNEYLRKRGVKIE